MIAIGSDHGGFELKRDIIKAFNEKNIEYRDFGCFDTSSVDYPDVAKEVCDYILANRGTLGVLCCGTGVGMSIAANKIKGIRAASCSDTYSAKYTRMHNDANVLCLGGRVVGSGLANMMVEIFTETPFEGGRHKTRVDKICGLEK